MTETNNVPEILTKEYWKNKTMDLRLSAPMTPVESGFPITSITIDLTTGCNLACEYCFTNLSKGKYKIENLTLEQGKKTIDWLMLESTRGNARRVDVAFWGGEPLIRFDLIKDLVIYGKQKAKEEGISIEFNGTTNVTLMTKEKIDFFKEHDIQFLYSIDGRKETHDMYRVFADGTGSFDMIEKNLEGILDAWPHSQVRLSYSEENIETFSEDVFFLYNKGFKRIAYSPVCEGEWPQEKIQAMRDQWDIIADWWLDLKSKGEDIYIKYMDDSCSRYLQPEGNHAPCGAGRGYVGISTEGAIYPCHRFHKFNDERPWYEQEVCIGNIDYGILNQEWRMNFVEWDSERDLPDSCKSCKSFNVNCTGGCWATNWDLGDSLAHSPEIHCESTLKNLEVGEYLVSSEFGDKLRNEFGPRTRKQTMNNIPMAQGCQCYNVEDNLFGRKTVNHSDQYSCLCNMATYGTPPTLPVKSCSCYNIEDQTMTHWDNEDQECMQYVMEKDICHEPEHECTCKEKDPIEEAIKHLKESHKQADEMTSDEKLKLFEFIELINEM